MNWNCIVVGQSCPYCAGVKVNSINCLSSVRPDLEKYLKNKEDGYKYTQFSSKKIDLKCPVCSYEKSIQVSVLSSYGFSCSKCSDGISIPEKFVEGLLLQWNMNFTKQKSFDWSQKKRYDFYISSLNMIIETHGQQHYEPTRFQGARTLKEEQENDALKEKLAKENGIENYIVIDCRKSEFEWLKEKCDNALNFHFEYLYFCPNWIKIWEESQRSKAIIAWELWNNGMKNTKNISEELGIGRGAVVTYLKNGALIGKCEYDPKKVLIENSVKSGKMGCKPVLQYTKDGIFIKEWESAAQIHKELGICDKRIGLCCKHKVDSFYGSVWEYKP